MVLLADPSDRAPTTPLLQSLSSPPTSPLDSAAATSTHLAALLFSHLLRASPPAKALARSIIPPPFSPDDTGSGNFFVPADGVAFGSRKETREENDEPPQTLLQVLCENLSLSFLSRSRADSSERELRDWDRLIVGYLCLLSQWLWEDPVAVRDFLDAGGLGVVRLPFPSHCDILIY
jgi:hypothetical protein